MLLKSICLRETRLYFLRKTRLSRVDANFSCGREKSERYGSGLLVGEKHDPFGKPFMLYIRSLCNSNIVSNFWWYISGPAYFPPKLYSWKIIPVLNGNYCIGCIFGGEINLGVQRNIWWKLMWGKIIWGIRENTNILIQKKSKKQSIRCTF